MPYLNLGIVAHVDAGKTTLTERLLYETGAIGTIGRVDDGTTQTDALALERARGITIKAAVAAFALDGLTVNLIDTPGHPDFIAEVDRALSVLDAAVLVVSAVEGVQAQTVVLHRALVRARLPTLVFVNKTDRSGADVDGTVAQIRRRLHGMFLLAAGPDVDVDVDVVADHDEELLLVAVERQPARAEVLAALARATAAAAVQPVFAGSARTGAGVTDLLQGVRHLLPPASAGSDEPVRGRVFKIGRAPDGTRAVYVRQLAGTLHLRDRVSFGGRDPAAVKAIGVFRPGGIEASSELSAGQVGVLGGVDAVRIGDEVGDLTGGGAASHFAPPSLQAVVVPEATGDSNAVHAALTRMADEDPLTGLHVDRRTSELVLAVYGEVQVEVIVQTLLAEDGLRVRVTDLRPMCGERPAAVAEATWGLRAPGNWYLGGLGFRIEPGKPGAGVTVSFDVPVSSVPLYVFKTVDAYDAAVTEVVAETLTQGLHGGPVLDAHVTLIHSAYSAPGTRSRTVRHLARRVLRDALERAGTIVCEPLHAVRIDGPAETLAAVFRALAAHAGEHDASHIDDDRFLIEGHLPAARVASLQRALPGLTHGEGVLEHRFSHYAAR